jgi:hypothetical protein
MMLEAARILAGLGALALLVSGAFWIKVAGEDEMDAGGVVVAGHVDRASKLLAMSVALSAAAASLAIVAWIDV